MLSRLLTLREQVILGGLALALLVGASTVIWHRSRPVAFQPTTDVPLEAERLPAVLPPPPVPPAPTAPNPEPAKEIAVAIRGAVFQEDVYYLPATARVVDLVRKAGGARSEADLSDINMAAYLLDGSTLTIPFAIPLDAREPGGPMAASADRSNPPQYTITGTGYLIQNAPSALEPPTSAPGASSGRINLNTASTKELESLPGIGPALAGRITAYREKTPFRTVAQLMEVSGIGEKRFDAIQPLVTAP